MSEAFLILDDNQIFAETLARSLTRRGFAVAVAHQGEEALALAAQTSFAYATIDLQLAQDSGLEWIAPLRQRLPQANLLVLTGYASIATTVHAIKRGADNYLAKPVNVDSILSALQYQTHHALSPLSVGRLEWEHIQRVLDEHQGNISSTARALSMHRRTLQRKLAKKPAAK